MWRLLILSLSVRRQVSSHCWFSKGKVGMGDYIDFEKGSKSQYKRRQVKTRQERRRVEQCV